MDSSLNFHSRVQDLVHRSAGLKIMLHTTIKISPSAEELDKTG